MSSERGATRRNGLWKEALQNTARDGFEHLSPRRCEPPLLQPRLKQSDSATANGQNRRGCQAELKKTSSLHACGKKSGECCIIPAQAVEASD